MEARETMIIHNRKLVYSIANGYKGRGLEYDDLAAEGMLGLIRGIEEFDPTRDKKLSTYVSYWIRQSIRLAIMKQTKTIRLPDHIVKLIYTWKKVEREVFQELGSTPDREEVSSRLKLTRSQKEMIDQAFKTMRFEEMTDVGVTNRDDCSEEIHYALGQLSETDRFIITHRYELNAAERLTHKEIGKKLGCSKLDVGYREKKALKKMKEKLEV